VTGEEFICYCVVHQAALTSEGTMGFVVRVTTTESDAQPNGTLNGAWVFHPNMLLKRLRAEIGMADCIELRVTNREPNRVYTCFQRDVSMWKKRGLGFRTLEVFAKSTKAATKCRALVEEIKTEE
jgi:hypothetical protein